MSEWITIEVITVFAGERMQMTVNKKDSIAEVVLNTFVKAGCPIDMVNVFRDGKLLEKEKTIEDYSINNGEILTCALRQRGGV